MSPFSVFFGCVIFLLTWVMMAFKISFIPYGRTLGTLLGAVLMIIFQLVDSKNAFEAINLETIALLFGTMIITVFMKREGFFGIVVDLLAYKCKSQASLLIRLTIVTAVLAAMITNDTACVFITPIVCELCVKYKLPFGPFLITIATSANVGSTLTPVGNPQNMIISTISGLSYSSYITYIGPATIVCLVINSAFLYFMYRETLSNPLDQNQSFSSSEKLSVADVYESSIEEMEHDAINIPTPMLSNWKLKCVCCVLLLVILAFSVGFPLGWTAITGACLMLLLDFKEPDEVLKEVDWGLLVFFSSLFIVIKGFAGTNIPFLTWDGLRNYTNVATLSGIFVYSLLILIASNIVSNVPLVLLLSEALLNTYRNTPVLFNRAWLLLSFVSTVAGNLTLVGSVANLIVCERSKTYYSLEFSEYARIGIPSTLIICVTGVLIITSLT